MITVIIVTNPGTFAVTDPFGSCGELAGAWPTWPLSPVLLSVWKKTNVFTWFWESGGEGAVRSSTP